jgi:bacterioferritin-associated ferredoxin
MDSHSTRFKLGARTAIVMGLLCSLNALADDAGLLDEARKVASSVPPKLLQVLNEEIARGGVAQAVGVCNEKAPQMAKAASEQSGWIIRRVSLRNRNPKAVPDAWERAALEEFDRRAAAGEAPATLEKSALVEESGRKEFRYMKALPVQQVCLACHGAAESVLADAAARIHALYPDDKAVGYSLGQIRGAMTIRKAQL